MLCACLTLKIARSFSGRTVDFIDTALSVQKDKDFSEEIFAEITFFDVTSTDFGENLIQHVNFHLITKSFTDFLIPTGKLPFLTKGQ